MAKTCANGCKSKVWSKGLCKRCWGKEYKRRIVKPDNPINPVSDKLKIERAKYSIARKSFLAKHEFCQGKLQGCTHYATEVHHRAGRLGKLLCDLKHFLAVCRNCHNKIGNMAIDVAIELGLSERRNGPIK